MAAHMLNRLQPQLLLVLQTLEAGGKGRSRFMDGRAHYDDLGSRAYHSRESAKTQHWGGGGNSVGKEKT